MTLCTVTPFPLHRARPALTEAEMCKRRALAATATDPEAGVNAQIRATQRLLDRPNLRPDARSMWSGHLAWLRARARRNVRAALTGGAVPDGAA